MTAQRPDHPIGGRGSRSPRPRAHRSRQRHRRRRSGVRAHDIRQHIARSLNDCARETEDGFSAPVRDRPRLPLARARRRERSRGGDGSAGQGWRVLSASARNPDRSLQPGRASMDTSTCKHWRGADRRALVMARLAVARSTRNRVWWQVGVENKKRWKRQGNGYQPRWLDEWEAFMATEPRGEAARAPAGARRRRPAAAKHAPLRRMSADRSTGSMSGA